VGQVDSMLGQSGSSVWKVRAGKVANIDWQEISAFEIKNTTIRPGSKNAKIAYLW
jgi:hypothetical protein